MSTVQLERPTTNRIPALPPQMPNTHSHNEKATSSGGLGSGSATMHVERLGSIKPITDLKSTIGPCLTLPDSKVQYPAVVREALVSLFNEYNRTFVPLVEKNREHPSDYRYALGRENLPINYFVQIDMVGLTPRFLETAAKSGENAVRENIRRGVFEIENSIAMYQLLENVFARSGGDSLFKLGFRNALDGIRTNHGKPIALLALTEEKLNGMRETEFGKRAGEHLTDAEVRELSGFDALLGPDQFRKHLADNNGECGYLLYVRASDPVAKLESPALQVAHPLLDDPMLRQVIKANAITLNIDAPEFAPQRRINDTKGYMQPMGMGLEISSLEDVVVIPPVNERSKGNQKLELTAEMVSDPLKGYLQQSTVSLQDLLSGEVLLRAKPLQGTYGCYGHVRGALSDSKFRSEVRRGLRQRGTYLIQPEVVTPVVTNLDDGVSYTYIDRNFLAYSNGNVRFLGGFRTMIPLDSVEAKRGRIHGSRGTVYREIF